MHPAIALLETDSIALGIKIGDAMVKRGPVAEIVAGTVHPGNYLILVIGDVAAVEEAVAGGTEIAGNSLLGVVFLPDVHADVVSAMRGSRLPHVGDAVGVIETRTVASVIAAADAAVKGATVELCQIHLADGLGGKGYAVLSGTVSDVEAAVAVGWDQVNARDRVGSVVIPRVHEEMVDNLFVAQRFGERFGGGGTDATG